MVSKGLNGATCLEYVYYNKTRGNIKNKVSQHNTVNNHIFKVSSSLNGLHDEKNLQITQCRGTTTDQLHIAADEHVTRCVVISEQNL